jgi:hypothetical protein
VVLIPGEAAYARYRTTHDQADSAQDAIHMQNLREAAAKRT